MIINPNHKIPKWNIWENIQGGAPPVMFVGFYNPNN